MEAQRSQRIRFVRARLQSCRKCREIDTALAAEVLFSLLKFSFSSSPTVSSHTPKFPQIIIPLSEYLLKTFLNALRPQRTP